MLAPLATLGTYKFLASALIQSIDKVRFLKSFIFGPSYVEGTWIGRFKARNESKWTVEHFEQSLDRIVIRGCAENADGTTYATWKSTAFIGGMLTYAYDCDVIGRNTPQQGIGIFQLQRKASAKPPYGIDGYSTDLTDGARSPNNEIKISDSTVPRRGAMERARQEFR